MTRIVYEITDLDFPIKLIQTGRDTFTVQYGQQIDRNLAYGQAASKIGEAILHALACDGTLNQN